MARPTSFLSSNRLIERIVGRSLPGLSCQENISK